MPTLTELQQELSEVSTAIRKILETGQAYQLRGQRYERADLDRLYKRKDELNAQIARLSNGGRLSHAQAVFGGRR